VVVVTIFLLISGLAAWADPRPLRTPSPPAQIPAAAPAPPASEARAFQVRLDGRERTQRRVRAGAHVVLTVEVDEPGEVAIEGLDLITSASPEAPALFDLLPGRPGRYQVLFTPVGGAARDIGSLLVATG